MAMDSAEQTVTLTNWPTTSHPEINHQVVVCSTNGTSLQPSPTHLSLHDLYHIAFLIRQKLVPDLIPSIFHHANLFHQSSILKKHDVRVRRAESPCSYLITPPIYSLVQKKSPVVLVRFSILANDWGLALSIGQSGFSAGILRRGGEDEDLRVRDGGEWDEERSKACGRAVCDERVVAVNTTGCDDLERHVVEWRADSEDQKERAWVRDLRSGDRIVVKAWCRWASFENLVREVRVEVFTAAIVR